MSMIPQSFSHKNLRPHLPHHLVPSRHCHSYAFTPAHEVVVWFNSSVWSHNRFTLANKIGWPPCILHNDLLFAIISSAVIPQLSLPYYITGPSWVLRHHWNAYLASGIPRSWFFLIPLQPFSVFASSSSCPWFLYVGTFLLQPLTPLFFLSPCLLTLLVMSYSFLVLNAICQWTSLSSHLLHGHLVASWQAQPGCLCLGKCLKADVSETEPLLLPAPAPAWASPVFWLASPPFQWLRPRHLESPLTSCPPMSHIQSVSKLSGLCFWRARVRASHPLQV